MVEVVAKQKLTLYEDAELIEEMKVWAILRNCGDNWCTLRGLESRVLMAHPARLERAACGFEVPPGAVFVNL
jgi:hypothetical protein